MVKYLIQIKKNYYYPYDDCPLCNAKSIIIKTEKGSHDEVVIQVNNTFINGFMTIGRKRIALYAIWNEKLCYHIIDGYDIAPIPLM